MHAITIIDYLLAPILFSPNPFVSFFGQFLPFVILA